VVFTLPAAIADIAYQNKAVIYDTLFTISAETMTTIAADHKHLGALPWRFSDAGRPRVGMVSACQHPKTCTSAEINRFSPKEPVGAVLQQVTLNL
jgi:hypothetical protein